MTNKKETPKTISIKMVESYHTYVVRESVEINVEDYPELDGMTEEEMKEYIASNWDTMEATDSEYYDSLYDECSQSDILRDKITDDTYECKFD